MMSYSDRVLSEEGLRQLIFVNPTQPRIHALYKKLQPMYWLAEEVDFTHDMDDWNHGRVAPEEKEFIVKILSFFASADGLVLDNYAKRLLEQLSSYPSSYAFAALQMAQEVVHAETYQKNLLAYIGGSVDAVACLIEAAQKYEFIRKKNEWIAHWIGSDDVPLETRLIVAACTEGLHFSGSFCGIFWFKKRGLLPSLTMANEFIARDEGMHCQHHITFIDDLRQKDPTNPLIQPKRIHEIVKGALEVELAYVEGILQVPLVGMNKDSMTQYVRYVADKLCESLGAPCLGDRPTENPFEWMALTVTQSKKNFFEREISDYQKAVVDGVRFDAEF